MKIFTTWTNHPSVKPQGLIRLATLAPLMPSVISLHKPTRPKREITKPERLASIRAMAAVRCAAATALSISRCNFSRMFTCAVQPVTAPATVRKYWKSRLNGKVSHSISPTFSICLSLRLVNISRMTRPSSQN